MAPSPSSIRQDIFPKYKQEAIKEAAVTIYMLDAGEGMRPRDYEIIEQLRKTEKPFTVALNKCDLIGEAADEAAARAAARLHVKDVVPISARDGANVSEELIPALIDASPEAAIVIRRAAAQFRREAANKLVRSATLIALAAGLQPVPLVDIPILLGNQIRLVLRVAAVYGEPMNAQHMRELVTTIAGGLFMRYLAEAAAKAMPFGGDLVAGAMAAAATSSIGQVAIEYFESGKKLTPSQIDASFKRFYRRYRETRQEEKLLPPPALPGSLPKAGHYTEVARLACGEGTGMLWAERHVAKCSFGHGTRAAAAEVASPTLGVLRLVSPASNEIAFLGGGRAVPITRGINPIGRAQRNAIVLLDPSVSREHARLIASREGWWIGNCSAANTMEIAGQACQPGQGMALEPGDIMRLGQTSLQLVALRPTYPDSTPAGGTAGIDPRAVTRPIWPRRPAKATDFCPTK